MGMAARVMKISEARGKLPEVARYLEENPDEVVLIRHRDLEQRLALVTESHLRGLETLIRELRLRLAEPFALSGSLRSGRSDAEIEEGLRELRAGQGRLDDLRLARVLEEG
jgi:hypothetical protein